MPSLKKALLFSPLYSIVLVLLLVSIFDAKRLIRSSSRSTRALRELSEEVRRMKSLPSNPQPNPPSFSPPFEPSNLLRFLQPSSQLEDKSLVILSIGYNQERSCEAFFHSIFSQTYSNWKLVYLDNGSTDNTYEVLQQLIKTSSLEDKVTLLRNPKHQNDFASFYRICKELPSDSIIVWLEESRPLDPGLFHRINNWYQNPLVWMTAGTIKASNLLYAQTLNVLPTFYAGLFNTFELRHFCTPQAGAFRFSPSDNDLIYPLTKLAHSHVQPAFDLSYKAIPKELEQKLSYPDEGQAPLIDFKTVTNPTTSAPIPLIVLSKNNPEQLKRALSSYQRHFQNLGKIIVYFQATHTNLLKEYEKLAKDQKEILFVQGKPEFPHLLTNALKKSGVLSSPLLALSSDELILTRPINGDHYKREMQKHGASLVLGGYYPTSLEGTPVSPSFSFLQESDLAKIPNLLSNNVFLGVFFTDCLLYLLQSPKDLDSHLICSYLKSYNFVLGDQFNHTLSQDAIKILEWCATD